MSDEKKGIEQAEDALRRAKTEHKQAVAKREETREVAFKAYRVTARDDFGELLIKAFEVRAS